MWFIFKICMHLLVDLSTFYHFLKRYRIYTYIRSFSSAFWLDVQILLFFLSRTVCPPHPQSRLSNNFSIQRSMPSFLKFSLQTGILFLVEGLIFKRPKWNGDSNTSCQFETWAVKWIKKWYKWNERARVKEKRRHRETERQRSVLNFGISWTR